MKDDVKLRLYNTATREKEEFVPLEDNEVKMYSCGPTVYDYAHLGHFRAYVFVDVLKRVLDFDRFEVESVMNITDVGHLTSDSDTGEDKVEKAAKEKKMTAWELSEYYTKDFFDAMKKLNVQKPSIVCKATDHIQQMIDVIKKLEENGYTYKTSDGIYYDTSKFKKYADFANLNLEELKEGARVEVNKEKRNPSDFALWKFSKEGEKRQMEWDSPWGKGFPGWHIECSAMSMHYLGDTLDIHTGGIDHIPVHHTNEIAQSEGATGKKFVRYWLHNDFVQVDGEKMSKSKKNFYKMEDIEERGFDPLALRYLFLTAHYRSKINFTWGSLESAQKTLDTLRKHVVEWEEAENGKSNEAKLNGYRDEFIEAVNDDLNTPVAIGVMWKMIRDGAISESGKLSAVMEFDEVLGLNLESYEPEEQELPEGVENLIEEREKLRSEGKYDEADGIRDRLEKEFDVIIKDTEKGTEWGIKKA